MQQLKLVALDEEDLAIVSTHVQDAVLRVGDIAYLARQKRVLLPMNRFVWEKKAGWFGKDSERRRAVLHFDRVLGVHSSGIDRAAQDAILSLLAVRFLPGEAPAGTVELVFSGDATMRLDVECIEARLADTGGAWQARAIPRHDA